MEYEETQDDETNLDESAFMEAAREKFARARDKEEENRELALDDIEFALLGEQWDAETRRNREKAGKPVITINKFPAYIRQVVNDARQNKPSIRVRPVDDNADPQTAEVINGLLRNIEVISKADIAYDTAIQQTASGGFGYIRINIDYAFDDSFDREIKLDRISDQFTVYGDPDSVSADGSDWNCCFVTDRISKTEFKKRYPENDCESWDTDNDDGYDWENEDGVWIAEYWKREQVPKQICLLSDGSVMDHAAYEDQAEILTSFGIQKLESRKTISHKVTQYIVSGKEILETNDWAGKYIPIIPVYGEEVIVEGKRYFKSLVRDSKDAQRVFNYWRTTTTELVALSPRAPWIVEEGSVDLEPEKWATANTENHAYLQYKRGSTPPIRQPFAGVPAGALQEAMNASNDLEATMGMFGASIGQEDNAVSGKAIIARQRESDTGTFHFIDNLSRSLRRAGEIILDLIPHVYTPGRIIRVLGEDGKESINVQIAQEGQHQPGQMPANGQIQGLKGIYDLTVGKYDVVVEVGPGFTTKRQEAANQMIEFSRVNPQASALISDLIAKNLDWPGAQEISERFKAMLPPQITGENPQIQQLQQMLQQVQAQSQQVMSQLQQQIESLKTDKTIDAEKLKIDAYNAETNRLKTVQVGMTPEQVQVLILQTIQQLIQTPDVTPGAQEQEFQAQRAAQTQATPQQPVSPAMAQPEG